MRKARAGFVRVEVSVRQEDAPLVRRLAAALADPARGGDARRRLSQDFPEVRRESLKDLLASAPLDDVDLERGADVGRDIDL